MNVKAKTSQQCRLLAANTEQHIATACPQGYVETLALRELEEELEDSGVCLVLGLPGHGKTALALQAMGRLAASQQFKPVWLTKPEQWEWFPGEGEESRNAGRQHLKHPHPDKEIKSKARSEKSESSGNTAGCSDQPQSQGPSQKKEAQDSRRYVVLLDDVFGAGHYDAAKKKAWEEVFDLVLAKVRAKQVKVILVSRVQIYEECKKSLGGHQLFDDVKTIDLRKSEYWKESDRQAILDNFLNEKQVRVAEPIEEFTLASKSCTEIGFPQVCRFFTSDKQAQLQGSDFFRKPLQFLHKQFEQMQEKDIRSYLVLILIWLEDGILSSEFLEVDNTDSKRRISDLCKQFDVKDVMTIREVQKKAQSLRGVYLSEDEEGSFRFTHQSICDSLVVAMCSWNLKRALDVCSIQQVCEYIVTKNSSVDQSGLTYTVPKSKWPLLAARLVKAMTSEELLVALDHPSLRDGEFLSVFVNKHLTTSHIAQTMQRDCSVHINFAAHFPERICQRAFWETIPFFIPFRNHAVTKMTSIASASILRQPALANHFLRVEILRSLPEAEAAKHLREALLAACYVSNEALVTDLLERRAEVTPDTVRAACESERDDVIMLRKITQRLPREKLDVSLYRDLMWICCTKGKVKRLKYLLTESKLKECQESLDQVLTHFVWFSHPASNSSCARHFTRLPELFSALKNAGARLDKTKVDIMHAAGHPCAFALNEHLDSDTNQLSLSFRQNSSTLLHEAARHGSIECLQVLMDSLATKGFDINELDEDNQTPLCLAVNENHVKAIEFLLKRGADPNIGTIMVKNARPSSFWGFKTEQSCSPLAVAASRHQYAAMELLLQHNAKTDVTDGQSRMPLHLYALETQRPALDEVHKGQQSCAKQRTEDLLVALTPNINQQDAKESTPLHLACKAGQTSLIKRLLSEKARVDVVDDCGGTVLHALADSSRYKKSGENAEETVDMIMETYHSQEANPGEGARQDWVNSTDKKERTPLHWAAERGNLTVVKALLKHKAKTDTQDMQGWTPLHYAASNSHFAVMDVLIAHGARIDAEDYQKRVPLHIIAERIDKVTDRQFWRHLNPELKVVLNRQNAQGQTALHTAAARGVYSLIHNLLQAGARADLVDSEGRLPLHCLPSWETQGTENCEEKELRTRTEKKLARATPDVNAQDKNGKTPLHLAAEHGNFSLITTLVDNDARTDITDNDYRLPLHCLALQTPILGHQKDLKTVALKLLDTTPDVNAQDKYGKTPLHLAAKHGSFSLITTLLDKDARTDTKDEDHRYPLHCLAAWETGFLGGGSWKTLAEKELVNTTPDVNVQDKYGKTPLHLAAEIGSFSLITTLLDNDARTDTKDNDGRLPLHYLALGKSRPWEDNDLRTRVEKELVRATADVNVQDKDGKTPLNWAVKQNSFSLITTLKDNGARSDTKDDVQRFSIPLLVADATKSGKDMNVLHREAERLLSTTPGRHFQNMFVAAPPRFPPGLGKPSQITTFLSQGARTTPRMTITASTKPQESEDSSREEPREHHT